MAVNILILYFSCGLIYCLDAKSISLNDLIAAEKLNIYPNQDISRIPEHLPPSKVLPPLEIPHSKAKKRGESSNTTRSLLKLRKIKSTPKPKKFKYLQKPDYKRKNLTTKREVKHVKINKKYIPLLRNIELLFDNILSSDSSETFESGNKRNNANKNGNCQCSGKNDSEDSTSQDERDTSTSSPSNEVENASSVIATSPQTDHIINDNVSRFRRNKNIPILLARNTTSFRRNDTRLSQRSHPTYNRRSEGHLPGNNGSSKRNALIGKDASNSENDVQNTDSNSRNNASVRFTSGLRRIGTNTEISKNSGSSKNRLILSSNKTSKDDTRYISEHEEQIDFQVGGIETKSPVFLSELASGPRYMEAQDIPTRSAESYEKSIPSNISSDKRIIVRNGQTASENKKNRKTNEAVGPKAVMIFDGYSVARDVNGENKMTEKAIHIHS